jgi:hypothetical protein
MTEAPQIISSFSMGQGRSVGEAPGSLIQQTHANEHIGHCNGRLRFDAPI